MAAIEATTGGVRMRLRVQPRASRSEVAGLYGDAIKIRVAAPAVDGAANRALLRFLAETFALPRSMVTLVSGAAGRTKVILVMGLSTGEAKARLGLPEGP